MNTRSSSRNDGFSNRPFAELASASFRSSTNYNSRSKIPPLSQTGVDGKDFINITTSPNSTNLGYALSMESDYKFTHPLYGPFETVRGFVHWIKATSFDDSYRVLKGKALNQYFKQNREKQSDFVENFQYRIAVATYEKIKSFPQLMEALKESTLPFEMYRVKRVDRNNVEYGHYRERDVYAVWFIPVINTIREALKANEEPNFQHLITSMADLQEFDNSWKEEAKRRKQVSDEVIAARTLKRQQKKAKTTAKPAEDETVEKEEIRTLDQSTDEIVTHQSEVVEGQESVTETPVLETTENKE